MIDLPTATLWDFVAPFAGKTQKRSTKVLTLTPRNDTFSAGDFDIPTIESRYAIENPIRDSRSPEFKIYIIGKYQPNN
jgi:hypothetical protein